MSNIRRISVYQGFITRQERVLDCLEKLERMDITASELNTTGIILTANNARRLRGNVGDLAKILAKRWQGIVKKARDAEENVQIEVIATPYRISDDVPFDDETIRVMTINNFPVVCYPPEYLNGGPLALFKNKIEGSKKENVDPNIEHRNDETPSSDRKLDSFSEPTNDTSSKKRGLEEPTKESSKQRLSSAANPQLPPKPVKEANRLAASKDKSFPIPDNHKDKPQSDIQLQDSNYQKKALETLLKAQNEELSQVCDLLKRGFAVGSNRILLEKPFQIYDETSKQHTTVTSVTNLRLMRLFYGEHDQLVRIDMINPQAAGKQEELWDKGTKKLEEAEVQKRHNDLPEDILGAMTELDAEFYECSQRKWSSKKIERVSTKPSSGKAGKKSNDGSASNETSDSDVVAKVVKRTAKPKKAPLMAKALSQCKRRQKNHS